MYISQITWDRLQYESKCEDFSNGDVQLNIPNPQNEHLEAPSPAVKDYEQTKGSFLVLGRYA